MSLTILPRSLGGSALARDYVAGTGEARRFYVGAPDSLAALGEKLAEVSGRFDRAARERAAAALRPTSERAQKRLARFVEEGGAMITTGQQTGLLSGPLYTLYKAITAAELARAAEAALGVVVLPVFWAASEDHDWAEVDHADLLTADRQLRRVRLPETDPRPLPMSDRRLGERFEGVVGEVVKTIAGSEYARGCIEWVEEAYRPGATVAEAFDDLVSCMLRDFDMLLADAADPALKSASRAVLEADLLEGGAVESALAERADALLAAGYHAQVPILAGGTNVFYHGDAGRERLYRRGGVWVGNDSGVRFDRGQLLEALEREPGRFSPNVLLRPVVESAVFPTLAYVAGPGEISYFAELEPLFGAHRIRPPMVMPRLSVTLLPEDVAADLVALDLELGALAAPRHELLGRLARRTMPESLETALAALKESTATAYDRLAREAALLDPTLGQGIEARRDRALLEAAEVERRIVRALKRHDPRLERRLDRVLSTLQPYGEPQERVLNALPFLAAYGPGLLREVAGTFRAPW